MRAAILVGLLLTACKDDYSGRREGPPVDADGDGYALPVDCNDRDAAVNPGAVERCDGLDNDCDGAWDEAGALGELPWFADQDGDGHGYAATVVHACATAHGTAPLGLAATGDDCDDLDPAVHPGAVETCDGIDNDCDALVDGPRSVDARAWHFDRDQDGYGSATDLVRACERPAGSTLDGWDCDDSDPKVHPGVTDVAYDGIDADCGGDSDFDADHDGYDAVAYGGTDCADANPYRFPGAVERWYDGVDQDCANDNDFDADKDGYVHDAYGGTDCADRSAAINPDRDEICDDGLDNDCDGVASRCVLAGGYSVGLADGVLTGASPGDRLSQGDPGFAGVGDLNGDGVDDLAVGALRDSTAAARAGAAYVVYGPFGGEEGIATAAGATLLGEAADDLAGRGVAGPGDVNGDGYDDLLVAALQSDRGGQDAGAVYLVLGPLSGQTSLAEADAIRWGAGAGDLFAEVAPIGDVDDDGYADFLVGAQFADLGDGRLDDGAVYLFHGPLTGEGPATDDGFALWGEHPGDEAGCSVAGVGDIDGDGLPDVGFTARSEDSAGEDAGAVYLLRSPVDEDPSIHDYRAKLTGEAAGDQVGWGVSLGAAGDTDGDGYDDVIVGARNADGGGEDAGAAYLLRGPVVPGTRSIATADAALLGASPGDLAGDSAGGLGDVNGDGLDDLYVGSGYADLGERNAGVVHVVLGPVSGTTSLRFAWATLWAEGAEDRARGHGVGDLDADGHPDVAVGAMLADEAGTDAGALYVFSGAGL